MNVSKSVSAFHVPGGLVLLCVVVLVAFRLDMVIDRSEVRDKIILNMSYRSLMP